MEYSGWQCDFSSEPQQAYEGAILCARETSTTPNMLPLILFISVLAHSMATDILGRECQTATGFAGTCINQRDCPWALEQLRRGQRPKLCQKSLPHVIACCPHNATNPSPKNTSSPETASDVSEVLGRVARMKCREYAAFAYQEVEVHALIARKERRSQCAAVDSLIIGGTDANPMEFPHMGLLGCRCGSSLDCDDEGLNFFCGGSLISLTFILTAAHCLHTREPVQLALFGSLERSNTSTAAHSQLIGVAQRHEHPQYRPNSTYHDIALLRLDREVVVSAHVRPACLHTGGGYGEQVPIATGWGFTDTVGDASDVLKKVGLRPVEDARCRQSYADVVNARLDHGIDSFTQMCAGGDLLQDTCIGDSGGPLQVYAGNSSQPNEPTCMYKIVGVTSFSRFICGLSNPGVYTRVSAYVPWIENIVWSKQ